MQPRVFGLVNTHSAAAKFLDDAVMRNGLVDEGVGVRHSAVMLGCELRQVNESERLHNSKLRQLVNGTGPKS